MKKISFLASAIALVLSGCGGSDDTQVAEQTFQVKAIDGYLSNAEIWVGDTCSTKVAVTSADGTAELPVKYQDQKLCVKAVVNQTMDSSRGIVTNNFELQAPAGSEVISPMTDLVVAQLAANSGMTVEAAQQAVVTKFGALGANADVLFGDYIAEAAKGSKTAQGITVIGETLVDENVNIDGYLAELIKVVADKVDSDDASLADFDPVIGKDGSVSVNHRPHIVLSTSEQDKLEAISVALGDAIEPIQLAEAFADSDNNTFTLSVLPEGEAKLAELGLVFDASTGILSGTPLKAGEIELQVYATDINNARSYPLDIEIEVITSNKAPTVDSNEKVEITADLAKLALITGTAVDSVIELDELFDDADSDTLSLTVNANIPGLTLAIVQQDDLTVKGKPTAAGDFVITVTANDGKNAPVSTELKVSIAENQVTPEPTHPLEGKTWYRLEHGNYDGVEGDNLNYSRVWCDSFRYQDGKIFVNARTPENRTTCSAANLELTGSSYKVEGDKLIGSYRFEADGLVSEELFEFAVLKSNDDIATGAKLMMYTVTRNEATKREREMWFSNKRDVEARIGIKSDDKPLKREFPMYLPAASANTDKLGKVTVQMYKPNALPRVDVFFDNHNGEFTCKSVREFYGSVTISGDNFDGPLHQMYQPVSTSYCSENDGTVIGWNLPPLAVNTVYSIILLPKASEAEWIEPVYLNVKWTGEGSNE